MNRPANPRLGGPPKRGGIAKPGRRLIAAAAIALIITGCTGDAAPEPEATTVPTFATAAPSSPLSSTSLVPSTTQPVSPSVGLRPYPTDVRLIGDESDAAGFEMPIFVNEYYGGWGVHGLVIVWDDGRFLHYEHLGGGRIDGSESLSRITSLIPDGGGSVPSADLRAFKEATANADPSLLDQVDTYLQCPQYDGVIFDYRFRTGRGDARLVSCETEEIRALPPIAAADELRRVVLAISTADRDPEEFLDRRPGRPIDVVKSGGALVEGRVGKLPGEASPAWTVDSMVVLAPQGAPQPAGSRTFTESSAATDRELGLLRDIAVGDLVWLLVDADWAVVGLGVFDASGDLVDAGPEARFLDLGRTGTLLTATGAWEARGTLCRLDPGFAPVPEVSLTAAGALLEALAEKAFAAARREALDAAIPEDTFVVRFTMGERRDREFVLTTIENVVVGVISGDVGPGRIQPLQIGRPPRGEPVLVWEIDSETVRKWGCEVWPDAWTVPPIVDQLGERVAEIPWVAVGARPRAIVNLDTGEVEIPTPADDGS